jgi:hypothetical protein
VSTYFPLTAAVTYEIDSFDPTRFNDIHALLHVGTDLLYASRISVGRGVILIPCGVITHAGNHSLMVAHTNGTVIAVSSIWVCEHNNLPSNFVVWPRDGNFRKNQYNLFP